MKYIIDRYDYRLDIEFNKLLHSGSFRYIEADSDEEAKQKAKELVLEKGEIIGDWWKEKNGKMYARISNPNRRIHISSINLYLRPDKITKWKPGIIIRNHDGKELNSQLKYGDRTKTKKMIKRYVTIENGIPIDLPDDIEILGEKTPFGFVLVGLKLV